MTEPSSPTSSPAESSRGPGRRAVLAGAAATTVAGAAVAGAAPARADGTLARTGQSLRADPFALGVASGDPLPDGAVLWTRLVRDPLDPTTMPGADIPIVAEVARDARFRRVVSRGVAVARARFAHSVHLDLRGLEPGREYWYRFRAGRHVSPAGRLRTLPRPHELGELRFAIANCQDYQNGYWPAYAAWPTRTSTWCSTSATTSTSTTRQSAYSDRRHTTPARPASTSS